MRFLSHLARARLLLYVCGASTSTGWAHTSHTQTQTHSQAKTHASPCANPYGDADALRQQRQLTATPTATPSPTATVTATATASVTPTATPSDRHCHGYSNSDSFGTSNCNPFPDRYCHANRYAASRCSDFGAARSEWDGQIPD